MAYKKTNLFLILITFFSNVSFGQQGNILFLMDNIPSTRNVNVAAFDDSIKFNFSLPIISSTESYINSDFLYSNIIKKRPIDGSRFLDVNSFLASLKDENNINFEAKLNLLRFGFKIRESYLSFSIDEKINLDVGIKKDLFEFLLNGNKNYINNQNIGTVNLYFGHLRELSIAYVKKIKINNNYLNVGLKPKYFFGLANVNLNNKLYYTNENNFSNIGINIEGDGTISGPIDIISEDGKLENLNISESNFDALDYITNTKNNGFGFDFGLNYSLNVGNKIYKINDDDIEYHKQKIKIDFSIINIGKINWKSNTEKINYQLAYQFNGFDITNSLDSESDNYIELGDLISNKTDSLETVNIVNVEENKDYSSILKPKFYLNTSFIFSKNFSAGLLFNSSNNGLLKNLNVSIHSSLRLSDVFNLTASYSNLYNLGVGLSLKGGPFQIYVLSDNLFNTFKLTSNPYELDNININLGINFIF